MSETQAALREEHAKSALELLNLLNDKLDYQNRCTPTAAPMPIRKKDAVVLDEEPTPLLLDFDLPIEPAEPLPSDDQAPHVDPLLVMMAVVKVQAMFRGRRVRRAERFTEALEKFRLQKQRLRSAIILQRLARGSIARRRVRKQKRAVGLLARAFNKFQFRSKLQVHLERKKTERLLVRRVPPEATPPPPKPQFPKRTPVVPRDIERFRSGVKSVAAIQKRFRDKRILADPAPAVPTTTAPLDTPQPVKSSSLVRKRVCELIERAAHSPTIVSLVRMACRHA